MHDPSEAPKGQPSSDEMLDRTAAGAGRRFRVTVRFPTLCKNLSAADQTEYTDEQVRRWLRDAGFESDGDYWLVDEVNLGHLDPAEVIEIVPLEGT